MDIDIFKLLKSQTVEVFSLLLVMRDFATARGMQNDVDRLKDYLDENRQIMSITDNQLSELERTSSVCRLGLFDTINPL